jgi:cell volume regulation protein A
MSTALILGLIGGLLVLAFLANRLSRLTRIPDVLMLMALGVVIGPGLHLADPASLTGATHLLGTLAIILVLFEGGLELKLRETLRHFPGGLLLAIISFSITAVLVALISHRLLGLPINTALSVGAVLGCTSSTVVLPVLQQLNASEPVRVTLMLEASWGDVLAVLTVGLLMGLGDSHAHIGQTVAAGIANQVGLAVLFAVATGVLWSRLVPVLSEARFWQVLTFSIVLLLYAGMEALDANGLIAVLAFGLTLANFPGVDPRIGFAHLERDINESQQALLSFHSELAFLVRTFFFVLIGAIADLGIIGHHPYLLVGTFATLLFSRWLAVQLSRFAWKQIEREGRDLILWVMPRGLITIVLALEVSTFYKNELNFLPGLAFAVILLTNFLVVVGSIRASRFAAEAAAVDTAKASSGAAAPALAASAVPDREPVAIALTRSSEPTPANPAPVAERTSRRWILHASLLLLLGFAALLLWYSKHPEQRGLGRVQQWWNSRADGK